VGVAMAKVVEVDMGGCSLGEVLVVRRLNLTVVVVVAHPLSRP
jgi:hypothetical protein